MSVTVKLIVASSFIFGSLSLNTELLSTPYIWRPDKDNEICFIKEDQCNFNDISKTMQQKHNEERRFAPIGATNMLLMELDDSLQKKAQQYAETCLKSLESRECPLPTATDGEVNISVKTYDKAPLEMKKRLQRVIQSWFHMDVPVDIQELIKSFTSENRNLRNWANYIRADVWKIGCGIADFTISETNRFIEVIVCFYGPPKLELGKQLYEIGEWCSNCPIGSTCLKEGRFANKLCKMEPSEPTPIFDEPTTPSSEIVTSAEDLVLKFPIWEGIVKNRVKKCKDQNQGLSFWKFNREHATNTAEGVFKSTVAFQEAVYIERRSCFKFQYKKLNRATSSPEVMAFAFVANSPDLMPVNTIISEDIKAIQEISLDIPWDDVHVYVGFGTRSKLPDAKYSLTLKEFKILNGNCS